MTIEIYFWLSKFFHQLQDIHLLFGVHANVRPHHYSDTIKANPVLLHAFKVQYATTSIIDTWNIHCNYNYYLMCAL